MKAGRLPLVKWVQCHVFCVTCLFVEAICRVGQVQFSEG